jgi:hypothetical protein
MKTSIVITLFLVLLFNIKLFSQDESLICKYLFASSNEITQLTTDAISLAVDAVWEASGITGVITTTGTLTQNPSNPDLWSYSSSPNDRMILNFNDGSSVVFTFYSIDGYKDGTAEDFKWSHQMDFNAFVQNRNNIRINSNTYPQDGKIYWQRTIAGTTLFDTQIMNLNISHTGNIEYDIGDGYAFYTYREQATGTSNTGSFSVNVNEQYIRKIANNSNTSTFILNTEILNNSSGNFSGTTYQYQNVDVFWVAGSVIYEGYYDKVVDGYQWTAQGTILKNGQVFGTLQFDGSVIEGTYGPDLVLHLNNGSNILLHTLIAFPATEVLDRNITISDFELMQNYPNPFNPNTVIRFQLPIGSNVTLRVFNSLGEEVEKLVNEYKLAGSYEVEFDAQLLSSGVYFYRLSATGGASDFIQTRKMILLK